MDARSFSQLRAALSEVKKLYLQEGTNSACLKLINDAIDLGSQLNDKLQETIPSVTPGKAKDILWGALIYVREKTAIENPKSGLLTKLDKLIFTPDNPNDFERLIYLTEYDHYLEAQKNTLKSLLIDVDKIKKIVFDRQTKTINILNKLLNEPPVGHILRQDAMEISRKYKERASLWELRHLVFPRNPNRPIFGMLNDFLQETCDAFYGTDLQNVPCYMMNYAVRRGAPLYISKALNTSPKELGLLWNSGSDMVRICQTTANFRTYTETSDVEKHTYFTMLLAHIERCLQQDYKELRDTWKQKGFKEIDEYLATARKELIIALASLNDVVEDAINRSFLLKLCTLLSATTSYVAGCAYDGATGKLVTHATKQIIFFLGERLESEVGALGYAWFGPAGAAAGYYGTKVIKEAASSKAATLLVQQIGNTLSNGTGLVVGVVYSTTKKGLKHLLELYELLSPLQVLFQNSHASQDEDKKEDTKTYLHDQRWIDAVFELDVLTQQQKEQVAHSRGMRMTPH